MLRIVVQRKLGKGSVFALTLLLVAVAATVSAVRPLFAASLDTCGYNPAAAPAPGGGTTVFNENTVTRAIQFYGVGLSGHIGVFTNDESGLYIGSGGTPSSSAGSSVGTAGAIPLNTTISSIPVPAGTTVAVSSGDSIVVTFNNKSVTFTASANRAAGATSIPVVAKSTGSNPLSGGNISDPSIVWGEAVPPTFGSGSDPAGRPSAPTIYLTDITAGANTGGDWEHGGQAATSGASALYGSWSPILGTKPVNSNNWVLGPDADPIPATDAFGGLTTGFNEGYGAEVAWNTPGLVAYDPTSGTFAAVQPGHTYRVQSITHDVDQNNGFGDVGEVCTTFHVPAPNLLITKTADAASVNAGEQIGFTVEVKNTGDGAATGSALNDPLPAGSGTGVTWAVDNSTGTPSHFALSGAAGSQSLGLASSTIPVGADWTIHITASTSATECGTYNNTATLTSTDSNPPAANASEACKPAEIHILKTADAAQVSAGDPIGFTLTVYNNGTGDAKGVSLSDVLPVKSGLSWSIAGQGAGWGGTCAIAAGSLTCGPKTVPANTTLAGSSFTVHITSPTTAATGGVCPGGSGVVNNTGNVTTTNDGSGQSSASTCVAAPSIHIVKTADAAQVSAGDPIGFTLTVYNNGSGDAKGVTLSDVLPTNAGLSWSIAGQGAGWGGSCAINAGTLSCGPATVPSGTTLAGSTFTVHITSPTTAATGGVCPGGSGKVDNTGNVTTTNDGSDQSSASTCVAAPDIKIVKTADAAQVNAGEQVGFTMTVYNTGAGNAYGATLSDVLPANAGLNWQIASQGAGWAGTCAINAGTLSCGPKTVVAGTTLAASTFTVHITSTTTAATGGDCPNSGVVDNTGNVTTTNGGSDQSNASTCVAKPVIKIAKTADAAQVSAGDPIGFTLTVYNTGVGDAKGVTLSDPLPTNAGLSWSIANQGAGWGGSCAIAGGTLSCGPVTVPAGTTKAASSFTVHITSPTTAATGGNCPNTGVVNNTGNVATTNDGSDQASASTCVAAPAIQIIKTADAAEVNAGEQIGFTVTVFNTGTGDAKGVSLSDPLPVNAGLNWQIANQGAGWGGSCAITLGTLNCGPVTVPFGTTQIGSSFTVHITSTTTAATGGVCPGGSGVVNNTGFVTTTNDGSSQSSAQTCVAAPSIHIVKTADAAQVNAGDPIGFTLTVYNNGSGDAKGVNLSDPLPVNAGLNWTIQSQGAGWGGSCAIAGGTLTCGPVTVPSGTTLAGSTFTVHVTSPTTAATGGVCPGGSGVVNNTGFVTTTNDGSGQSSASTCVAAPSIQIVKTADAAQVNAGDPIGFTVTVYNAGTGDAKGVSLSDPLPTNAGLNWTIQSQGAGWGGSCAIAGGTLSCGPVTVPAGTTQLGSSFTVHITSPTTGATGGDCPNTGVVNNTGFVTTTNDGSGQSSAQTCVAAPSIHIVKTADAAQVNAGDPIGFTLTVYNNGSGDAKGVNLSDPLPANAGLSWSIQSQGAGWGGSCAIAGGTLSCGPVTVPSGTTLAGSTFTVHVTSPTTAATGGVCPGGSGVVNNTGFVTTTNDGSGQSSASTCVAAPSIHIVKTADAAQVNAGDPIGFTLTVYNNGTGDAKGVTLSDPLPANAGLSWQIAGEGAGWGGSCAIAGGTLSCGPVTVPSGTTLAASTFTVHVTSPTTAATGGVCPGGSGVVNNTGFVTTTNDGSGQSSASTCVAAPAIKIVKTADAAQVSAGDPIGFTVTVYNTGTGDANGVNLSDPLPTNAGLNWTIQSQGAGWGGSCAIAGGTLSCGPATVPSGTTLAASTFTVHITSPTTAATGGSCPNTGVVDNTGFVTTTNDGSGQSSASTCVAAPSIHIVKTADAAQVNAGDPIGFTLTVYNNGTGDAKGVTLSDLLPTNAGLSWQIDSQGAGWAGSCAINAGTLNCGPVTVPFGTTLAGSSFTVHITSATTAATGGVCPGGSGVVDNTGNVTTTNAGSDQSSASTCVAAPSIHIVKTADAAQVMAGDQIGFTLTVSNSGTGDAYGVSLSDPLPTNPGLSWQIDSQGAGWAGTCAIAGTTLTCGPVTVPAGTTQAASSFTVHITSGTTLATGGICPDSGVVNNTGSVTTTNDGSDQSTAQTCVQGLTDLQITKTGSPATQHLGDGNITWTMVVTNNGPLVDTNVTVGDAMPAGNTFVGVTTTKGTCTGGAIVSCSLGTLQVNESVTIVLVTTPTITGPQVNTATVVGDLAETTLANNTATAQVLVVGKLKPPCTALLVRPKQLYAGRATKMHITVLQGHKVLAGVRVQIKGPGISVITRKSNSRGRITQMIKPKKAGIVYFKPIATVACKVPRVGITGVFTPPVTG